MNVTIRDATAADLPAINDIYNHYVHASTCTYQLEPDTLEERQTWFAEHGPKHPIIVAERNREVVGWGSLSPFRTRAAYARTVEDSVYIRHNLLHQGIGIAILRELIEHGKRLGHHTIIAGISAEQAPSVALHEKLGFRTVANLREVGYKHDQWLDVVYMQLML
jgi:L-amino acid N-acyltransferase